VARERVMGGPSATRQVVRHAMSAVLPRRLFMTSGPPSSSALALTFDDGPHPAHTPVVLDRLRALDVRATFFVVGAKAEAHPDLVRRIADDGHELGHHSYAHAPPGETSAVATLGEARRTSDVLLRLTGRRPRLYRPPHGKLTPGKLLALWALRQAVVLWNRDPKDFASEAAEPIRRWSDEAQFAGGDIVLLPDVHPHIAPALDAVVERIRRLGLGFATPTEWLDG